MFPSSEDYLISLLVNPCGANGTHGDVGRGRALGYDCCMGRFGFGEYGHPRGDNGAVAVNALEVFPSHFVAKHDEPLHNILLVDENSKELPYEYSRRADDHTMVDETCLGTGDPHPSCLRGRLRSAKSTFSSPCTDHNQTVDAALSCFTPDGRERDHCMQVSYAQTALIHVCGGEFANSDRCGTFIEVHRQNGSPYDAEKVVLAETKITTRVTNGHTTTTVPLTYMGHPDRILCAYHETRMRVGSMVKVLGDIPGCCCPPAYNSAKMVGAFFCPRKAGTRDGPFADSADTLQERLEMDDTQKTYPFCHEMREDEDVLMCSKQAKGGFGEYISPSPSGTSSTGRFYTFQCPSVQRGDNSSMFSSSELDGTYDGICQIGDAFKVCGSLPQSDRCVGNDSRFSFAGEIGKITDVPADITDSVYGVSFNNGRTTYPFPRHWLELHVPANNYELWFVQRNRFEKIVQKKKRFRVVWPRCSFDPVNDRYFPFAQLAEDKMVLPVFSEYDGVIPKRNYATEAKESVI